VIDIELPMPPSANALWRGTGRNVMRSRIYTDWIKAARAAIEGQRVIVGPYVLVLALPRSMRGDVDNRHKGVNDLLQHAGLVPDDKLCEALLVLRTDDVPDDRCRVVAGPRCTIFNFRNPHALVRAMGGGPTLLPLDAAAGAEAA